MSRMTPKELAVSLGRGLLSFPVTPFTAEFGFNEEQYRKNLDWLCSYNVSGLFSAGGTGEFFSLTPSEVEKVVSVAVAETKGRVPVIAPAGTPEITSSVAGRRGTPPPPLPARGPARAPVRFEKCGPKSLARSEFLPGSFRQN